MGPRSLGTNDVRSCRPCVWLLPFKRLSACHFRTSMRERANRRPTRSGTVPKPWPSSCKREHPSAAGISFRTNYSGWLNTAHLSLTETTKFRASREPGDDDFRNLSSFPEFRLHSFSLANSPSRLGRKGLPTEIDII